jgi:hypothetical protein
MKEETNSYEQSTTKTNSDNKGQLKNAQDIRLSSEQIEEINADEYSLPLFYATRTQPFSLTELKRQFVEPEPKKAESVIERFLKVGLIHLTDDGKYFSNYPDNYLNYSDYRYDGDLEAKKDSKVFHLMKDNTGKKEYWKDKSYFSIDGFFTDEQSKEIQIMLNEVRLKTKEFSNKNDNIEMDKMKFRRFKFYDMFWSFALFALLFSLTSIQSGSTAFAISSGGGGNDPSAISKMFLKSKGFELNKYSGGGGNDPSAIVISNPITGAQGGGGGHDPESYIINCKIRINNKNFNGFFNINEQACIIVDEQIEE